MLVAAVGHAQEPEQVDVEKEPKSEEHYRTEGVTVMLPADWKPFSYLNESGERDGFLLDLWAKWAEKNNIDVRLEFSNASEALESLKNGEVDILGGVAYSGDQSEVMNYSDALHSASSFLAIKEKGPIDCSNALSKGNIGFVGDANVVRLVDGKYPETKRTFFPDEKSAIAAFLGGRVDGVGVGYAYLLRDGQGQGKSDELTICRTLFYEEVYAGTQKVETELLELINEGLSEIPAEELKQIEDQWFISAEVPKVDWKKAVLPAAGALIFVLLAVIMWQRRRP